MFHLCLKRRYDLYWHKSNVSECVDLYTELIKLVNKAVPIFYFSLPEQTQLTAHPAITLQLYLPTRPDFFWGGGDNNMPRLGDES